MPAYPTPPNIVRDVVDLKRRVRQLEIKVANLGQIPAGSSGNQFDANVIWNGSMESGTTGWDRGFWAGSTPGTLHVESADPLDQLYSLRMDEVANGSTQAWWEPGHSGSADTGSDVFATAPGEQWQLTCLVRATVAITHAQLTALTGLTGIDCYALPGGNGTRVDAADVPLTANTITTLSGLITVPASRNYISIMARLDTASPPTVPWSWWLDGVALQRKL